MIRPVFACLALTASVSAATVEKIDLAVLYIGNADTPRAADFVSFLETRFTNVRAADRARFDPASAPDVDVVMLDWSQGDLARDQRGRLPTGELKSPLGDRDTWHKPTVLLDSAGLLIAAPWQTAGSYG